MRRILAATEATLTLDVRWRGAALERLLDEEHARLVAEVVAILESLGWVARIELTYSEFGERGSYDVLAWHAPTRTLLVIEVKTDLPSAEATVRKLDEKTRLEHIVARRSLDWDAVAVSRLLVMPEESTLRRRVQRHQTYFRTALPARGVTVRAWLREPAGTIAGLWFLSPSDQSAAIRRRGGRSRVRVTEAPPPSAPAAQ